MTDTNPYYYTPLTAEEISAHVTNIRLGLASRNVHPLDQKLILADAMARLVWPDTDK